MNPQDWYLRAGRLKDRLVSYGTTVVRPVRFSGLKHSALADLLAEIRAREGPPLTAPSRPIAPRLHLTLLPIQCSRFSLPQDAAEREACLAELAVLRHHLPPDPAPASEIARLEEAAQEEADLDEFLARSWEAAVAFFDGNGLPRPPPGGCRLSLTDCRPAIAPTGQLFLALPDLLGDLDWAAAVARKSRSKLPPPGRELHVTLLRVNRRQTFDWLASHLPTAATGPGEIRLASAQLVAYKHRTLSHLLHRRPLDPRARGALS